MNYNKVHFFIISIIVLLIGLLFHGIASADGCEQWVAKIASVQGKVFVQRSGKMQKKYASLDETYCPGDTILVQERSRATILLRNETTAHLDQNTRIVLSAPKKEETSLLNILIGAAHFFSRTPRTLEIITPFVNAGVEGTEFIIRVKDYQAVVTVFEGQVKAVNEAGSLIINSGQSAIAKSGQAPVSHIMVRPSDAVQWALYYPPVLYYRTDDFPGDEISWHSAIRTSIKNFWDGNLGKAFEGIDEVPDNIGDPRFYTYRASLFLTVGRVDEANGDIKQALNIQPGNSRAIALESIIALVRNEKEKSLNLAKKSFESEPDSAAALIALSYARQAYFDLDMALESIQKAVKLDPENSLAWARLAELWQATGYISKALTAAKKSAGLNPDFARTQTVLGFAYLTQINTTASIKAFKRAIELDQGDPLPRLGLGLAKIREGMLEEGRREIETAASLDPLNSLIRSYLGKAYYEGRRDKVAMSQYKMAKNLDPLDPTPYFYDAIMKQSLNRPVEALDDMQKAIELNDNRAVYRSRQSLDDDLASRTASLARIYNNLGFQQLALVEGWKSLSTDPGSYSAHRFLADTYSVLPRHEVARVSELLQSQLLQPINITPVQPHLAESDLSVLESSGPGDMSFNEFNPLFNRNNFMVHANGIFGENDTFGEELVISAVKGKASFSAGQYLYKTNGFRENNDLKKYVNNVFTQVRLSHKTSVMAEFRLTDTEKGDLKLNYDPDDFSLTQRENEESTSVRIGMRHSITPGSDIIATAVYKDSDEKLHDSQPFSVTTPLPFPPFSMTLNTTANIDLTIDDDGYMTEVQHLFRTKQINTVSGAGYFTSEQNNIQSTEIVALSSTTTTSSLNDITHTNIYLYSYINYFKKLSLTAGWSADFFESDTVDRTQFNPKLGITWNVFADTTFRAAVFKTLTRSLISSQTLEPTHVAGFNQFYDDISQGTESWRYGIAIDQKFAVDLYGGAEFSKRDMNVPITTSTLGVDEADWREQMGRAYLYWTPYMWLALSSEYKYERQDRDEDQTKAGFIEEVITHSFPFGINFYSPGGFGARLTATYTDQNGRFFSQGSSTSVSGGDHFWLVDAFISYRLAKRSGIISFGGKNLFDKSFKFQDTDPDRKNPVMQPERMIFAKFTLAF